MTYRAKADFSDVVKAAGDASKKMGDLFSKGMTSSLGGSFRSQFAKLDALQKKHQEDVKKFSALQSRINAKEHVLELERTGKLLDARTKAEVELDKIRSKFARAVEQQDKKEIDNLKEQRKIHEEILELTGEYQKDSGKFTSELKAASKEFDGLVSSLKATTGKLNIFGDVGKTISDAIESGFEGAGDKITGLGEELGDAFVSGVDVTSLSKKISAGLGKGLGKAGDALGSAGFGKLGMVAGSVGAVVGALGALLAAFIAVDKKVKEFNKDIVRTHGALSVMRLGAGNLNDGLKIVKHTVQDLSGNLGVTEDEAKQLFASLDNGNITLARITGGTRDAAEAQQRLSASLRDTYTAANMTGVGLSEYADNLTNYVNDLGMSTETVNDNFRSIAKMASESGFSTRRFYSMVVQATSGQSALNVSLDQTGDLLLRMSKIMGMKKAAEMVGDAAGDMGAMSAQDRIRMAKITGARGVRVFRTDARSQAANFAASHGGSEAIGGIVGRAGLGGTLAASITDAIKHGQSDPDKLVKELRKLSMDQQQQLISSFRNTGDERDVETGRQLSQLTSVIRAGYGSESDRVDAYGSISAGGSIATRLAAARKFMNPDGRVSEVNRAVFENVTGTSGHQTDALLSLARSNAADMEQMRRISGSGDRATPEEKKLLEQLQKTHHVTVQNGHIFEKRLDGGVGHELSSSDELLQTNPERTAEAIARTRTEAEAIAYQTMDATTSVADILENKVAQYIQRVYEWMNGFLGPLLSRWMGNGGEEFQKRQESANAFQKAIEDLQKQAEGERSRMAALGVTATSATKEDERQKAREDLHRLQQGQSTRAQQIQNLRDAEQRVRSGNTFDTRAGYVVRGAQKIRETVGGPRGAMAEDMDTGMQSLPDKMFKTWQEAQAYVKQYGGSASESRLSNADAIRRITGTSGAAVAPASSGAVPPTTPATVAPTTPATVAPTTTPTAAQTPPVPTQAHAEAATAPVVAAQSDAQANATEISQREIREGRARERREAVNQEKLLKSKSLGDALAESKLPDAIAEADAKMRLLEGIYANGASSLTPDAINRLMSGEGTDTDIGQAGMGGAAARALRFRHATQAAEVHDFISQDRGGRTVITPIDRADQVMGMKPGGPVATAGTRGGGGNVNINIHGGDERRVFNVVRRAIQQAGITPSRVPGGG